MSGDWLTQILTDRWFPAAVTYFLGLLTGWLIWSSKRSSEDELDHADTNGHLDDEMEAGAEDNLVNVKTLSNSDEEPSGKKSDDQEPVAMKLGALESELTKARKLLAETDEENAAFSELLGALDEAVKRANGRLKLIMKSIKRAKIDD